MPDLGYTEKEPGMTAAPGPPEKKTRYPDLTLRDENVEKIKGQHECELDEEYTAVVRLRVKGISDDEFGSRLDFDVLEMDEFEPADGSVETDEPDDKTAKKPSKALRYS